MYGNVKYYMIEEKKTIKKVHVYQSIICYINKDIKKYIYY